MGTKFSSVSKSGYNASPPSDDGTVSASNQVNWSKHKTKLADPIATQVDDLQTSLTNHFNQGPDIKSINYTTVDGDFNKVLNVTAAATISLISVASVTTGYKVIVYNSHSAAITVDLANAADALDGTVAGSVLVQPKSSMQFFVSASGNYISFKNGVDLASAQTITGDKTLSGATTLSGDVLGIGTGIDGKIAAHANLVVRTDATTPDSEIDVTADELIVKTTAGAQLRLTSVNVTADNTGTLNTAGAITSATVAIDTWYGIWVIHKTGSTSLVYAPITDGLSDVLGDVAGTYTHGAFVGAVLTDGTSDNTPFIQTNKKATLLTMAEDVAVNPATTAAQLATLRAPPNTVATAMCFIGSPGTTTYALVTETSQTDQAPTTTFQDLVGSTTFASNVELNRRVDSSSQIRWRSTVSATSFRAITKGWEFK